MKSSYENMQAQIVEVLQLIVNRQAHGQSRGKQYIFTSGNKTRAISFDQILFFESLPQPHKIAINTFDSQFQIYDSLSSVEKSDPEFVRAHKSFVVNIRNVASIDTNHNIVVFKNGSSCPLANSRTKKVKQQLLAWKNPPL
ncbi:LytR/AlgR family response regulator transcription factor [Fundicoccus culcitae]|uniref:LytTR family transcriptional regulator DNA-binding domain-containing protein n=1 Tax=Fundicoccus culcitae TaxID=2969821 RepID=A0ABY5P5L4_9LACT|nr:LytTR family DNA-binding domain-containing protein [Fundicoccus culcitae]UUX34037.1 LytTR family transcriptional regulator DNA-binding domain-containing protein [Fundicoccus culcitae]